MLCKIEDGPDVFLLTVISYMRLQIAFLGLKQKYTVLYP
jgi:hypothetical protein